SGMSHEAVAGQLKISWWAHILAVFAFISYVPHSKYFHMFTGPVNLFVRTHAPGGSLAPVDIEKEEVFGAEKATDTTWKDRLDAFACMECGRCQDVCPAFRSEKPLSPKMILCNLEKHLLENAGRVIARRRDDLPDLLPEVHTEGEIWTCTTCGACQHVCPVEIEHISKIVSVRQSEVLMKSRFPAELNPFFRNLETNGNPWGIGFAKRGEWAEGLDVPHIKDVPDADYLLFVGCAGAFDEENRKSARAVAALLKKAGVRFGTLGAEEKCCGDSARRLGQEYLFQTLAAENISLFHKYGVRNILTICPHGFNALKHEYPALGGVLSGLSEEEKSGLKDLRVVHYVALLAKLLKEKRLRVKPLDGARVAYHDSCYLGRHNGLVKEPRSILAALAGKAGLVELKENKKHSFCCGAGGGLMWTEEKLGRRINHLRTDEILRSGAAAAAVSCPFCQTMLRDGLKDKGREDVKVFDLAQLTADNLAD
ncbi:MAG: (Fe-S)-binding protein, partial [Candidatus Aminicenantes bacterium]|nr:(Fe-S)-binding protein [Candidatus Aminicenantes bacterium]